MKYLLCALMLVLGGCSGDQEQMEEAIQGEEDTEGQEEAQEQIDDDVPEEPIAEEEAPIEEEEPEPEPAVEANLTPSPDGKPFLDCKVDAGVESKPGTAAYACTAKNGDGSNSGMVKGRWKVVKGDGSRVKVKGLRFRDAGYDVIFEIPTADAGGELKAVRR